MWPPAPGRAQPGAGRRLGERPAHEARRPKFMDAIWSELRRPSHCGAVRGPARVQAISLEGAKRRKRAAAFPMKEWVMQPGSSLCHMGVGLWQSL